jgi:hypothetical protein
MGLQTSQKETLTGQSLSNEMSDVIGMLRHNETGKPALPIAISRIGHPEYFLAKN